MPVARVCRVHKSLHRRDTRRRRGVRKELAPQRQPFARLRVFSRRGVGQLWVKRMDGMERILGIRPATTPAQNHQGVSVFSQESHQSHRSALPGNSPTLQVRRISTAPVSVGNPIPEFRDVLSVNHNGATRFNLSYEISNPIPGMFVRAHRTAEPRERKIATRPSVSSSVGTSHPAAAIVSVTGP
jgi:hypothetical protein